MKRMFKIFVGVFVFAVVLTLAQASTFADIVAVECAFFVGVLANISEWFGTVVFWKYMILILSLLALLVIEIILLIKKLVKKRKVRKSRKIAKASVIETHQVKTANEVRMSTPGRFIRVIPKDQDKR